MGFLTSEDESSSSAHLRSPLSVRQGGNEPVRVAIIANAAAPYRLATHRYVARQIPEIKIYSVFTHEGMDQPWDLGECADVNPVHFGVGESVHDQMSILRQWHERRKAGRILEWMRSEGIGAAVISGYNDQGRLRLLQRCPEMGIATFLTSDSNIRGDLASGWRRVLKRLVLEDLAGRVSGVLPMGSNGVEFFARYGFDRARMHYFPLIPDLDLIRRCGRAEAQAAVSRLGLDPSRRRLVYSGRLVGIKRVDLLLGAFARLAAERPDWDLVIVGDGPLRRELEGMVPASLKARVTWAGFQPRQEDVTAIYRNCDALVLPSEYEAWSLVVIEAAACGLAVACSDVVGVAADLVHDGVNGRVFRSGDSTSLEDALRDVTNADRIDAMRSASVQAFERWFERFNPATGLRAALAPLLAGVRA
jgi:glycosyltransferase involved in cell wall biosynthesis